MCCVHDGVLCAQWFKNDWTCLCVIMCVRLCRAMPGLKVAVYRLSIALHPCLQVWVLETQTLLHRSKHLLMGPAAAGFVAEVKQHQQRGSDGSTSSVDNGGSQYESSPPLAERRGPKPVNNASNAGAGAGACAGALQRRGSL